MRAHLVLFLVVGSAALSGCRGTPSAEPPVHLNPNMDLQDKYKAQEPSEFFADGRATRMPVAGTVARGLLKADDALWRGCVDDRDCDTIGDGEYVKQNPLPITRALMDRGQERYNIYCAPCHDQSGFGKGAVTQRKGLSPVPSYHQDYIRAYPDGKLFSIISNGSLSGLMRGYAHQIPVPDRWAIVAYLRALQRSQHAAIDDVPQAQRGNL